MIVGYTPPRVASLKFQASAALSAQQRISIVLQVLSPYRDPLIDGSLRVRNILVVAHEAEGGNKDEVGGNANVASPGGRGEGVHQSQKNFLVVRRSKLWAFRKKSVNNHILP